MGLTHTRMQLALVHEKLVTCTKRTPEPLQMLSTAYPMKSGVKKEHHEEKEPQEEEEPCEETNPHRKPWEIEEHHCKIPQSLRSTSDALAVMLQPMSRWRAVQWLHSSQSS